ncbi:MAG: hypothetical protein ACYDA2_05760 [Acidimicrobiales bacterium]
MKRALDRIAPARFGGRLGLAVVAVGLVVIGIGWNGAAGSGGEINHVPVVQAQLPWLLSGGFLGLGIVVLGAALIVVSVQRESQARLKSSLDAIADALGQLGAGRAVPDDLDDLVVAGSASYHRSSCALAQDRAEAHLLTVQQAVDGGLSPCRVCNPPVNAAATR